MGAQQSVRPLDPEVGGALTPTGVYKDQAFFGGIADLIPRMKTAGILLYGAMGAKATTADSAFGTSNTGVYTHKFTFDTSNPASQPWMSFRKMTPGNVASNNYGETGFDCKINALRLTFPARGKMAMRVSVVGRDFVLDDASSWTWANSTYDGTSLIPEVGRGYMKIGGTEYPSIGAQLDIVNGLTTPDDEMVIGDFNPDDFIAQTRSAVIRTTYKWENEDLYRAILTGTATGTDWNSLPFFTGSGSNDAVELFFEAPGQVPGAATAVNYGIKIRAEKVAWQVKGAPALQAGGIVVLNLIGTVVQPDSGDYLTVEIINENDGSMYA
jgi:hypothetical protein